MFPALRNPVFVSLLVGTFLSNVGGWMHNFASRWIIYELTGDAWLLGLDALLSGLTTAVLLPWGGVLADRMDRKTILIVSNTVQAATVWTLAAAIWLDRLTVAQILAISFINGVANAAMAPANQSLLPNVVTRGDLSSAIAWNSFQFNVSRVLGPTIGAVVYGGIGSAWCFALNGASFLVLVGVLLVVRLPRAPRRVHHHPMRALGVGMRYVMRRGDLTVILVLGLTTAFFSAPLISMLPALVKGVFHLGPDELGLLQSTFGLGAVIGALLLAVRRGEPPRPWRSIGLLIVLGLGEVGLALSGAFEAALGLMIVLGVVFTGTMVRLGAAMQHGVLDEVRGRVMSLHTMAFRGGQAAGSFVAGVLAGGVAAVGVTGIGLRWTFGLYGVMLVVTAAAVFALVRGRGVRYLEVEPAPAAA